MTEFDRLFDVFCRLVDPRDLDGDESTARLITHVRELEAKAAKFDALVAACEREDTAAHSWSGVLSPEWGLANEARKESMK